MRVTYHVLGLVVEESGAPPIAGLCGPDLMARYHEGPGNAGLLLVKLAADTC